MAYEAEGKLYKKFDTVQVTDSFRKREFVVEIEDGAYPQVIKFQLTQNNCDKLDPYNEGEPIKVTFSLKGREYSRDGKTSYFTNLDAWRLDKVQTAAAPAANNAPADSSFPSIADDPGSSVGTDTDDLPF